MNCCAKCFADKKIIGFIGATGVDGDCDYCGAEEVRIIPAEDLGGLFDQLLELYEEADEQTYHEDESLADLIAGWKVFSGGLAIDKQNEILDEIRFGPRDPKDRSITTRSSDRWQFKYITPATNVLMPTNLTIEAEMRFDGGTSSVSYRTGAGIFFTTSSNIGNGLWIGSGLIFLLSGDGNARGASAAVDTTSSFHTYRIQVTGTNAPGAVSVYQDGILQLTGALLNSPALNGPTPRIGFGEASIDAAGVSEWETFTNNASLLPSANLLLSIASNLTLTLHGLPTKTYLVQAKTNLAGPSWVAVTNITLAQPTYSFADPQAGVLSRRFYQAVGSP